MLNDCTVNTDTFDRFISQVQCFSSMYLFLLMYPAASKGCEWCTQWRCQAHKRGGCQLDQSNTLPNNSPQPEATRWPWSSKWYHRPFVVSNRTFLGWWRVRYIYWRPSHWRILFDSVRRKIRNAELDISEDYFLTCLYPKGLGDPNDVERGFLRSGLLIKVCKFPSIIYLLQYQTSDLLCYFHITIILRGIWWARVWRRAKSEEAEIGFSQEGNKDKCRDSSSYGRESHTESNCVYCNSSEFSELL